MPATYTAEIHFTEVRDAGTWRQLRVNCWQRITGECVTRKSLYAIKRAIYATDKKYMAGCTC